MINKRPISVTLQPDNVLWLKGRAEATGCRSVSALLDRLVTAARTGGPTTTPRTVVGTIEIDPSDPSLGGADSAVRKAFEASMNRARPIAERSDPHRNRRRSRRA